MAPHLGRAVGLFDPCYAFRRCSFPPLVLYDTVHRANLPILLASAYVTDLASHPCIPTTRSCIGLPSSFTSSTPIRGGVDRSNVSYGTKTGRHPIGQEGVRSHPSWSCTCHGTERGRQRDRERDPTGRFVHRPLVQCDMDDPGCDPVFVSCLPGRSFATLDPSHVRPLRWKEVLQAKLAEVQIHVHAECPRIRTDEGGEFEKERVIDPLRARMGSTPDISKAFDLISSRQRTPPNPPFRLKRSPSHGRRSLELGGSSAGSHGLSIDALANPSSQRLTRIRSHDPLRSLSESPNRFSLRVLLNASRFFPAISVLCGRV